MKSPTDINVSSIVDNQPIGGTTYLVLGLCFAAMASDGYNMAATTLAAPGIVKAFAIGRADIAPIFSSALVGMLVGALVSGFLGDKIGRKRGILISTLVICLSSFACGFAQSYGQLLVLRFLVGLGLGGLLPNVTALIAEFAPKRVRGMFSTYTFMGITSGGMLPGLVSPLVQGDWRTLFIIGGAMPLVILPFLAIYLPESLKFLALRPDRKEELRTWLVRLSPQVAIPSDANFVLDETVEKFTLSSLFKGKLSWITPTLWLVFVSIMLVQFFISSWLVLILTQMGFSLNQAAIATSLYWFGGICGGLVMGIALDFVGPVTLAAFALAGCAITALIGVPQPPVVTYLLVGLIGFSVLGAQVGMSAIGGLLYPTAMRSKGVGFAHSIGRCGAIGGPLLAGFFVAKNSSLFVLFLVPVVPLAIATLCFLVITKVWTGRFRGRALVDIKQLEQR